MNFGSHPPLSHGSIESGPLIMRAEATTIRPLHEFGPCTVYVHEAIESFVGYRSYEAARVALKQMSRTGYERAILVVIVPRGKRKERSYVETSHASTVLVEGWDLEPLPSPHHADGRARYVGFDQRWNHDFADWLKAMCRQSGRKVLFDLRGHDPQPRERSAHGTSPGPAITPAPIPPAVVSQPARRFVEGSATEIVQTRYERDPAARAACLAHHGLACQVCGFDFAQRFGQLGTGFIHVHHLEPLADTAQEHVVDPIADLRPVCPNCHAMLHRRRPPLALDELRLQMRS